MSVKLDQTIDYTAQDLESSSLSHMKLVPLSGNQTQTVGGAGVDITFEIPVQAGHVVECSIIEYGMGYCKDNPVLHNKTGGRANITS